MKKLIQKPPEDTFDYQNQVAANLEAMQNETKKQVFNYSTFIKTQQEKQFHLERESEVFQLQIDILCLCQAVANYDFIQMGLPIHMDKPQQELIDNLRHLPKTKSLIVNYFNQSADIVSKPNDAEEPYTTRNRLLLALQGVYACGVDEMLTEVFLSSIETLLKGRKVREGDKEVDLTKIPKTLEEI